jgi:hypothetical protein
MWAVAEISWEDPTGTPACAPATMEDTSVSGACLRVQTPVGIGSRLTVKWHKEQFRAIARNCRRDGKEFLLGVRREKDQAERRNQTTRASNGADARPTRDRIDEIKNAAPQAASQAKLPVRALPEPTLASPSSVPASAPDVPGGARDKARNNSAPAATPDRPSHAAGSSTRQERKVMESKKLFPNFWRRQQDEDAPAKPTPTEAFVNKPNTHAAEPANAPRPDMLSYDDIYHAAGLMSPRSGYGIHKVVEMLNSERIRALSKDIQRASVLMALDAAGASADELLQDATRRQRALDSYEDGQCKQVEEFEARKMQENTQIQTEVERITAHYAERIRRNQDQVAEQKEALRNWQMAKEHESQRISEVIELCAKQPANDAQPAAAPSASASSPVSAPLQPSLVTKASAGR